MELKKALEIVKHHNKWRRGEIEDWTGYTAKELGIAIDKLIKYIETNEKEKQKGKC